LCAWNDPRVIGINLGGSEHLFPTRTFQRAFDIAGQGGYRRTVHAGEAAGPESILEAVELLGAERIGHGVAAGAHPQIRRLLMERDICVEACLGSNLRTGVCATVADHPLAVLVREGVPVTLNTDDPTFFETSMANEADLALTLGVNEEEMLGIIRNGFTYSFAGDQLKAKLLARYDAELARFEDS